MGDVLQASVGLFWGLSTDTGRNLYVLAQTSAEQQVFVVFSLVLSTLMVASCAQALRGAEEVPSAISQDGHEPGEPPENCCCRWVSGGAASHYPQ